MKYHVLVNMKIFILICLVLLSVFLQANRCDEIDDDLEDFDFNEVSNNQEENKLTTLDDIENENEGNIKNLSSSFSSDSFKKKEETIRKIIYKATRDEKVINALSNVIPILRAMTPEQKLALVAVVKNQILASENTDGWTLDQVKMMFGSSNSNLTSQLLLPISLDTANVIRRARHIDMPEAQELRGNRLQPLKFMHTQAMQKNFQQPFRRNIIERGPPINKIKLSSKGPELNYNCDQFINGLCIETSDYPMELIMSAIRRNKGVMVHLLADYRSLKIENDTDYYEYDSNRRQSDDDKGSMCQSVIKFARPKKAKATSGNWKFIVNTPEHTQTLRLEKCTNPQNSCSYLTDNFKSKCVQIYNYHRLLTWDKKIGLHMDIFKVPSCCSCHVEGYKANYPPYQAQNNNFNNQENFQGDDIDGHNSIEQFEETEHKFTASNPPGRTKRPNHNYQNVQTTHHGPLYNKNKVRYRNKQTHQYHEKQDPSAVTQNYDELSLAETKHHSYAPRHKNSLTTFLEAPKPDINPFSTHHAATNNQPPYNNYISSSSIPAYQGQPTTNQIRPGNYHTITQPPIWTHSTQYHHSTNSYGNEYDLDINASDPQVQTALPYPTSQSEVENHYDETNHNDNRIHDMNKRINYNYHPILDFFTPTNPGAGIQKRSDVTSDEEAEGWRPITQPSFTIKAENL